jgi:hypothetical protein
MQGNVDTVTALRRQIEEEYEAAHKGLHDFALTARHDAIQNRLERIGGYQERLITMVGEQTAMEIVADIAERMGDTTL